MCRAAERLRITSALRLSSLGLLRIVFGPRRAGCVFPRAMGRGADRFAVLSCGLVLPSLVLTIRTTSLGPVATPALCVVGSFALQSVGHGVARLGPCFA